MPQIEHVMRGRLPVMSAFRRASPLLTGQEKTSSSTASKQGLLVTSGRQLLPAAMGRSQPEKRLELQGGRHGSPVVVVDVEVVVLVAWHAIPKVVQHHALLGVGHSSAGVVSPQYSVTVLVLVELLVVLVVSVLVTVVVVVVVMVDVAVVVLEVVLVVVVVGVVVVELEVVVVAVVDVVDVMLVVLVVVVVSVAVEVDVVDVVFVVLVDVLVDVLVIVLVEVLVDVLVIV
mmetsp:Transcript_16112/g.50635  ORF Transcript_16112/g.50635 Transcript_16112/m.50635 type:complete len:230 (-) Transcript_16112:883-1572(-)